MLTPPPVFPSPLSLGRSQGGGGGGGQIIILWRQWRWEENTFTISPVDATDISAAPSALLLSVLVNIFLTAAATQMLLIVLFK